MVVVTASGNKCSLRAESLLQLKAEDATVELQGAFQISDLEVHVTDTNAGIYGLQIHFAGRLTVLTGDGNEMAKHLVCDGL